MQLKVTIWRATERGQAKGCGLKVCDAGDVGRVSLPRPLLGG